MSNADQQLLTDVIHRRLNDAISYNLYTGLAYGRFLFRPLLFLHTRLIIMLGV